MVSIWKRCPKDVYVGQQILEIGVSSAILSFNEGMNEDYFSNIYCNYKDAKCINEMKLSMELCRKRERENARNRKGFVIKVRKRKEMYMGLVCVP